MDGPVESVLERRLSASGIGERVGVRVLVLAVSSTGDLEHRSAWGQRFAVLERRVTVELQVRPSPRRDRSIAADDRRPVGNFYLLEYHRLPAAPS